MNTRFDCKGQLPENLIQAEAKWLATLAEYQAEPRRSPNRKQLHAKLVSATEEIHEILDLRYNG